MVTSSVISSSNFHSTPDLLLSAYQPLNLYSLPLISYIVASTTNSFSSSSIFIFVGFGTVAPFFVSISITSEDSLTWLPPATADKDTLEENPKL